MDENDNAILGPEKKYNCKPIQNTSVSDEKQVSHSYSKEYKFDSDEEKKKVLDSDDEVVNGINVSKQTLSGNAFFFIDAFPSCSYPYIPGTLVKYPGFPDTYWCCLCKSGPTLRGDRRISVGCSFCNTWAHKSCIGFSRFSNEAIKDIDATCIKCHPYI